MPSLPQLCNLAIIPVCISFLSTVSLTYQPSLHSIEYLFPSSMLSLLNTYSPSCERVSRALSTTLYSNRPGSTNTRSLAIMEYPFVQLALGSRSVIVYIATLAIVYRAPIMLRMPLASLVCPSAGPSCERWAIPRLALVCWIGESRLCAYQWYL